MSKYLIPVIIDRSAHTRNNMASGYYAQPGRERERSFLGKLWFYRRYLIIILTPLLLSPLPLAVKGTVSHDNSRILSDFTRGERTLLLIRVHTWW